MCCTLKVFLTLFLLLLGPAGSFAQDTVHIYRSNIKLPDLPPPGKVVSRTHIAEVDVTELTLANGMRAVIKPMSSGEDELEVSLFALGGYASLPQKDYPSGKLSSQVIWASGFDDLSGAALSQFFRDLGIDFSIKTRAQSRYIDVFATEENLKTALKAIHLLFTHYRYDEKALIPLLANIREGLRQRHKDPEILMEDHLMSLNSGQSAVVRPLTEGDLNHVSPGVFEAFYKQSFTSPADFTVVITGQFKSAFIEELVARYLANIPSKPAQLHEMTLIDLPFPEKPRYEEIPDQGERAGVTALSFPLALESREDNFHLLQLLTQALEVRFRKALQGRYGSTMGVDVSFEYPSYPLLTPLWLRVQFRNQEVPYRRAVDTLLQALNGLSTEGMTLDELDQVKQLVLKNEEFWARESRYWNALLSNYYKWGWDIRNIPKFTDRINATTRREILETMISSLNPGRYTVLTLLP